MGIGFKFGQPAEVLSLTIEYGFIKLLKSRGREVLDYRSVIINPQFFREGLVSSTTRVAGILKNTLQEMGESRGPVISAMPGFQSTLHILQMPRARGLDPKEFIPREASRSMGVSPATSHLLWHRLPDREDRMRWLVASASRRSVTSLLETARLAGLRVQTMDLRPFALARSVNRPEAVVAWLAPDGCDLVVVRDCHPVAYQSLYWGLESVEREVLVERVTEMAERTIASYERETPGGWLTEDAPLYVCGSSAGSELDPGQAVAENLRRPLEGLSPPLACPDDFPVDEQVINLGLALRET
jgi:hypothetical protein